MFFISTFLVLVRIFVFIFGEHRLSFSISTALRLRKQIFLIFHMTTQLKCHLTFSMGLSHPESATYQVFGGSGAFVNVETKHFWFVKWSSEWCVPWLRRWGFLIVTYHSAKFGVHRPSESGDITFLICHVSTIVKCHMALWVGSPHFKSSTGYVLGR